MSDLLNRFAPDFSLPSVAGPRVSLTDLRGQILVIHFWSAGCAWSRRADAMLVYRMLKWEPLKVRIIGIASNYTETEEEILHEVERRGVRYPVLYDLEQSVASAYRARVTPQFYITDRRGTIRYAGALDDATFQDPRPKTLYVERAVNALVDGHAPDPATTPPYGCDLPRASESGVRPSRPGTKPPTLSPPPGGNSPTLPPR